MHGQVHRPAAGSQGHQSEERQGPGEASAPGRRPRARLRAPSLPSGPLGPSGPDPARLTTCTQGDRALLGLLVSFSGLGVLSVRWVGLAGPLLLSEPGLGGEWGPAGVGAGNSVGGMRGAHACAPEGQRLLFLTHFLETLPPLALQGGREERGRHHEPTAPRQPDPALRRLRGQEQLHPGHGVVSVRGGRAGGLTVAGGAGLGRRAGSWVKLFSFPTPSRSGQSRGRTPSPPLPALRWGAWGAKPLSQSSSQ